MKQTAYALIALIFLLGKAEAQSNATVATVLDLKSPIIITNINAAFDGGTTVFTMVDATGNKYSVVYLSNYQHEHERFKPIVFENRTLERGSEEQLFLYTLLKQWLKADAGSKTTHHDLIRHVALGLMDQIDSVPQ